MCSRRPWRIRCSTSARRRLCWKEDTLIEWDDNKSRDMPVCFWASWWWRHPRSQSRRCPPNSAPELLLMMSQFNVCDVTWSGIILLWLMYVPRRTAPWVAPWTASGEADQLWFDEVIRKQLCVDYINHFGMFMVSSPKEMKQCERTAVRSRLYFEL